MRSTWRRLPPSGGGDQAWSGSQVTRSPPARASIRSEVSEAGLPKASLTKPVLTTIEKRLVLRKLGELQEPDRTALRQALTAILE